MEQYPTHSSRLRAGFKKMGDQTIIIVCWMEEKPLVRNPSTSDIHHDWRETVQFNDSSECRLSLTEEEKSFYLTILFNGSITKLTGGLTSAEVLTEIHSFQKMRRVTQNYWDAKWMKSDWTHECLLPYNNSGGKRKYCSPMTQIVLNFSNLGGKRGNLPSVPGITVKESEKLVLNRLSNLLHDTTFSDVTFQIRGEIVKAHSAIVAAGSPVLSAMFQHDFEENRTRVVDIEDTRPEVFQQLLHYLYTGTAPKMEKEDITVDLLVAADKYGVEALKNECSIIIGCNLNVNNVVSVMILAHLHSIPNLYNVAINFMAKNSLVICSHPDYGKLMENYPKLCLAVTQFMFGATTMSTTRSSRSSN